MRAIIFLMPVCLFLSCQKHRPPLVDIVLPQPEQRFRVGDTVHVAADMADADILLNESFTVVGGQDFRDTITAIRYKVQAPSYHLSEQFIVQRRDTIRVIVRAFGGSSISVEQEVKVFVD